MWVNIVGTVCVVNGFNRCERIQTIIGINAAVYQFIVQLNFIVKVARKNSFQFVFSSFILNDILLLFYYLIAFLFTRIL